MINLPPWLTHVEGDQYIADPDTAYPSILKMLSIEDPDRYDMEVANGILKKLARWHARQNGQPCGHLRILGHSGRRDRWGVMSYEPSPRGDITSADKTAERNRAVRSAWRKLMGV